MGGDGRRCLVLRLAGPLQSWGSRSQFNRRDTDLEPTKSGIVGLLAAADGRRREDPIVDLVRLRLGVRVDQPGSVLRDYHTVSDLHGAPLLSASVNAKGAQQKTAPAKHTGVTHRFYLQDAVFVAVVEGDGELLDGLASAITHPGFPLALGRRACPPTQPILLRPVAGEPTWVGGALDVLGRVPWQAAAWRKRQFHHRIRRSELARAAEGSPGGATALDPGHVRLPVTLDEELAAGLPTDVRTDVPVNFSHKERGFTTRRVAHDVVLVPTGIEGEGHEAPVERHQVHDPFALLGG